MVCGRVQRFLKTQAAVSMFQARVFNPEDLESFLTEAQMGAPARWWQDAPLGSIRRHGHIRGEPLPLPMVTHAVIQGVATLQHVHEQRLVHCSFTRFSALQLCACVPLLCKKMPLVLYAVTTARAKEPHQRFAHIRAFVSALEHVN
jgi:hypothetical protein